MAKSQKDPLSLQTHFHVYPGANYSSLLFKETLVKEQVIHLPTRFWN